MLYNHLWYCSDSDMCSMPVVVQFCVTIYITSITDCNSMQDIVMLSQTSSLRTWYIFKSDMQQLKAGTHPISWNGFVQKICMHVWLYSRLLIYNNVKWNHYNYNLPVSYMAPAINNMDGYGLSNKVRHEHLPKETHNTMLTVHFIKVPFQGLSMHE